MAAEAAILGVPAIRCSSFVGRLAYLEELEHRYELIESFLPADAPRLLQRIGELRPSAELAHTWGERRATMLADKIDLTSWYRALCDELTR